MKKEISCRMLDVLFRALKKKGLEPAVLAEGSGYTPQHLRIARERIEWSAFTRVCANAGRIWTVDELHSIGGSFFASPMMRAIFLPGRLLFSPRAFYKWAIGDDKGLGKQMVPCVRYSYEELGSTKAVLNLMLPSGYERNPEFFLITRGSLSGMPRALGFAAADVKFTEITDGGRFEITFPPPRGILSAIRRAITYPIAILLAARELKQANEDLVARNLELEDARAHLDELNKSLERKVEERTAELAGTVRQLEEAQRARDQLFANINHEFRTPLSIVMLTVADLEKQLGSAITAATQQRLSAIESAARRLLRLVDAVLLIAARREGKLKPAIVSCDVVPLLTELAAAFRPAADARGLTLSIGLPSRAIVGVDLAALERMVTNLVSNAIKFTPTGGSIDLTLVEKDSFVDIAVRDSGVGIDDEFKPRIFGRFEQGAAAVNLGAHGSGVGLSLVKELAEAHGGSVAVESAKGRGSLFTIRLPVTPPPSVVPVESATGLQGPRAIPADFGLRSVPDEAAEVFEPSGAASATILVAEDDPDLRMQIAAMLRDGDHRVVVAADGISALRLARKYLPDLLVTDVGMPGMDGIELTRQFRALDGNRLSPVLLLTAYGSLGDRLKGLEAGAVDYVLKPFEPAELKARINSQLEMRRLLLKLHEAEKLAALGVLSSGLAHELRNPANGIVNAIAPLRELLPVEAITPETPAGQLLGVIELCANQLAGVSRQLLGLRSTTSIDKTAETLPSLLQRAITLAGASLEHVPLKNTCQYVGNVNCSGPLMVQVLANLIENGAQAAGAGGWVQVASRTVGDRLVVEVSDSGGGVPKALRERVFEPFFTTKVSGVNRGLGLTNARDIARRHGGDLEIRDSDNGTAVFWLEVPLGQSTVAGSSPRA